MTKSTRTQTIRRLVQLAFAAFILTASVRHSLSAEHLPSTDAFCPFGAVETLWQFASSGIGISGQVGIRKRVGSCTDTDFPGGIHL